MKYFVVLLFGSLAATIIATNPPKIILSELKGWSMVKSGYNLCAVKQKKFTDDDYKNYITNRTVPSSKAAKCMLSCMSRKAKMYDKNDQFTKEQGYKRAERFFSNNQTLLTGMKKIVDVCAKEVEGRDTKNKCQYGYDIAVCADREAEKLGIAMFNPNK